jgi:hypothetical protein
MRDILDKYDKCVDEISRQEALKQGFGKMISDYLKSEYKRLYHEEYAPDYKVRVIDYTLGYVYIDVRHLYGPDSQIVIELDDFDHLKKEDFLDGNQRYEARTGKPAPRGLFYG